jgi:hypothetical protein
MAGYGRVWPVNGLPAMIACARRRAVAARKPVDPIPFVVESIFPSHSMIQPMQLPAATFAGEALAR